MKTLIVIGLTILFVFSITSQAESQPKALDTKNPIKIGYLNPLTGPATLTTSLDLPGIRLAIEEINATGGVLGRPLMVIPRDDKLNPENALREAKDLVINEKVFCILGVTSSGVARAISSYMKDQKKIFGITVAKSEKLTGEWGHRYVFRCTNNVEMENVAIAKAAKDIFGPLKKIYNLSPDYEGGHAGWRTFFDTYKKMVPDAIMVGEAWPKLGTPDFTAYLTAVMNSDAELMFTSFYQTDALTMIKQSIALGVDGKLPMIGLWWGMYAMSQNLNKGFYPKKTIGGSQYAFWAIDTPQSKRFVDNIKSKYGVYPEYAVSSYSFVKTLANAINKVGALDTEKVIDALEGAIMESPIGQIEIRACDHQAMWPTYAGVIGEVAGFDFYAPQKPLIIGREAYPSCEEIAKARRK